MLRFGICPLRSACVTGALQELRSAPEHAALHVLVLSDAKFGHVPFASCRRDRCALQGLRFVPEQAALPV
eukprot:5289822-Alexandrium_andersonii.AAC.1